MAECKQEFSGEDYVPDVRFERTSVISTIRLNGKQAPMMFKGTLTGATFGAYTKEVLAPTLGKGDIVVLDNYASHKVKDALKPIYERGATVLFLPPYSPDYNPIELSWSKMKPELRRMKAKAYDELVEGMKTALDNISVSDISGWFKHCKYSINK